MSERGSRLQCCSRGVSVPCGEAAAWPGGGLEHVRGAVLEKRRPDRCQKLLHWCLTAGNDGERKVCPLWFIVFSHSIPANTPAFTRLLHFFFFPPQFIPGISCNSNFIMNNCYTHINTFSVYVMWPKFPVTGETISTFLIIEPKPGNTKSTSNWFVFSWSLLRQTDLLDYYIILAHYLHSCWSDALIATIVSYLNNLFSSLDVCDG